MAEVKRSWFSANKALITLVIVLVVIIVVLIISGLKKVNASLLLMIISAVGAFIWFVLRKPKQKDLYQIIEDISLRHYRKTQSFLTTSIERVQCIPIPSSDNLMYLNFIDDGLTFEIRDYKVVGLEHRYIYPVLKQREKSTLIQRAIESTGALGKATAAAAALNIEPEDIGLK